MITQKIYETYRENLISGNRIACSGITADLIKNGITLKELYVDLFQRAMYEVGRLWEENIITPAVEHMATGITEYCMSLSYPLIFGADHKNKTVVISCLANEYHQIGAKMVADIFEMHGWHGYFLGANTPVENLITLIKDKKPDVLGLSISIYFNMPQLINTVKLVRRQFADLVILAGGQGLKRYAGEFVQYEKIFVINSISELERYINENN
ncbi:MAG: cobalamin-dependent protein [Candidatus Goldbacteria bacterium]|nr:cobalamin-dependent protein [Candidatus Goldiibacteriota bacterium]